MKQVVRLLFVLLFGVALSEILSLTLDLRSDDPSWWVIYMASVFALLAASEGVLAIIERLDRLIELTKKEDD